MSDPRKPLKIRTDCGDTLEIDPFHDEGHVVLAVKTSHLDGLKEGTADVSLSLADLRKIEEWTSTHRHIWALHQEGLL